MSIYFIKIGKEKIERRGILKFKKIIDLITLLKYVQI